MVVTIACFLILSGALVLIAGRAAKQDPFGQSVAPGRSRNAALLLVVTGLGLFAYALYRRTIA